MSTYIDGFVLPLNEGKLDAYTAMAEKAGTIWKEHGALGYVEAVLEDPEAKEMVDFPKLAGAASGETVVIAFITYRSREHRDEVNAKVLADPRLQEVCGDGNVPFECARMAYGGFQSIVEH